MSQNPISNVWWWKDPDSRWKDKVVKFVKAAEPSNKDVIVLHCMDVKGFDESIPLTNYVLNICTLFNVLENDKTMFLNCKDLLLAIELCLRRQERKENTVAETQILDEKVIRCHKAYVDQFQNLNAEPLHKAVVMMQEFLKQINCIDLWHMNDKFSKLKDNSDAINHMADFKFLILGNPHFQIFKNFISTLAGNADLFSVAVETPLDISLQESPSHSLSQIKVTAEPMKLQDIYIILPSEVEFGSASEEYVEEVMIAFLSLLVNSRNEIALSKSMISPVIDFNHEAFTELKHLSVEKDMPMCQVAISYVTRVRLGGKGYAPASNCPMLPHLKALEFFVDLLNQMQTVIEEVIDPRSAIKRLINILKKKLLKCSGNKFKENSVENVAENLKLITERVSKMKLKQSTNDTPQICQETLDTLHSLINFVNCNYWTSDPELVLLKKHSTRTPLNLPPLLGYFRSPDDESSCGAKSIFDEDSNLKSSVVSTSAVGSYFHHSESSSISVSCTDSSTPFKMSFKGCLNFGDSERKENMPMKKTSKIVSNKPKAVSKIRKRSILDEITNQCSSDVIKNQCNSEMTNNVISEKNCEKKQKISIKVLDSVLKEKKIPTNNNSSKKESKKGLKTFKQIPGQGKITCFFTMGKNI